MKVARENPARVTEQLTESSTSGRTAAPANPANERTAAAEASSTIGRKAASETWSSGRTAASAVAGGTTRTVAEPQGRQMRRAVAADETGQSWETSQGTVSRISNKFSLIAERKTCCLVHIF